LQRATESNRIPKRTICLANSATPCMDYSLYCSPCWSGVPPQSNQHYLVSKTSASADWAKGLCVGNDGFEPPEHKALDLQSSPLPFTEYFPLFSSGGKWTRTTIFGFSDQRLDHLGYSSKILRR
jgi:hypothetical protein